MGTGDEVLLLLGQTQIWVSSLTFVGILWLHNAHAVFFGVGTLVSAASGKLISYPHHAPR